MKRYLLLTAFTVFSFLFLQIASAQSSQSSLLKCYNSYVQKGDSYRNLRNYDQAIQQYQAAKLCGRLSTQQINQLDSLIAVTKTQQKNSKNIIIRKY